MGTAGALSGVAVSLILITSVICLLILAQFPLHASVIMRIPDHDA